MAKVIVKATDRRWQIHKDDGPLRLHASRRGALAALAKLWSELKAQRSLIKFEAREGRPRSN
jgi:hypothetical protein